MQFVAYDYQKYAIEKIISQPEVGLFLDMGMGKTVTTLTAVQALMYDYCSVHKALVIAPTEPAKNVWPQELSKWDHLKDLTYTSLCGSKSSRIAGLSVDTDLYFINRENVFWLVSFILQNKMAWPFDMVIIDELSSFKSASSQRFRALKKVRKFISRIVGLTGTPAANGLMGLWSQCYLLDGGKALGRTLTGYRQEFFLPDKRGPAGVVFSWKLRHGAEQRIYDSLSDLCVSMKSEDYLTLPETMKIYHEVNLLPKDLKLYEKFKKESVLEDSLSASTAAVLVNKLLQFADGFVYSDEGDIIPIHEQKLLALCDLIESANGQPVLLFYAYRHEKQAIMERYPEAVDIKSPNAVERWNRGEISILLANPASAGHGLNLQFGGHIIIWYGATWDLELYQQANKRLSRPGQTKTVLIHHLYAKDTYDEIVMKQVLPRKSVTQNSLLESLKAHLEG